MEFIVLSLVPRIVPGSCWQSINSGWKYVIIFHLLLQIHSAPFSQYLVWMSVDSFTLWIQPMQKEEGHLEDGRTTESEFLFHRLFPAKLLQIYPMPRSEITIFPITTTYSTLSYNHHLPYPLGLSVITTVTTLRILYYLLWFPFIYPYLCK